MRAVLHPVCSLLLAAVVVAACAPATDRAAAKSVAPDTAPAPAPRYDPSRDLGALFVDAQMMSVYPDSKTLVDATPNRDPAVIADAYEAEKGQPDFSINAFVRREFTAPGAAAADFRANPAHTMEAHITALWPALTRAADTPDARSTLLPLPLPYIVPGGRFREIYYWDSYFTMLGLLADGRTTDVAHMLDNFAHLVRTVGHIPNGNRTYYLSRSQPPYFAAMVGRYAEATDSSKALVYLDALEREYAFWMDGADSMAPGTAQRRVVKLADGTVLNRYWDDRPEPRPESFKEDFTLALTLPESARPALYRNLRAAAESGWDFSSRWMRNPRDLRTLETTALAPVDLNSLLVHTARTIAALRRVRDQRGDNAVADRFSDAADARSTAIRTLHFDSTSGFFYDLRWATGERVTDRPTLAAVVPLYLGIASNEQAAAVQAVLARDFLKPGGFTTTLIRSGQQWDAPNGWPPLQWLAIEGVRRYGGTTLADSARTLWLALNRRVYQESGKMTEKYDVWDLRRKAGGGEYPTQDGFGWTNGVAQRLARQR